MKSGFGRIGPKMMPIAAVFCLLPFFADFADAAPQAVIEDKVHDFGAVLEGTDVVHGFAIRNAGDAPLDVQSVRTG